jgi:hypothetical protein
MVVFLMSGAILLSGTPLACADGGTVRASVLDRGLLVTAFTAPSAPRTGLIDVSVLVQDAATGRPVSDARIRVRASRRGDPARAIERTATTDDATNKLLYAAVLDVPEAGSWSFRVRVEGSGEPVTVEFEVEVGEPLPGWLSWIGWIASPGMAVLLFGAHRALVRHKNARAGRSRRFPDEISRRSN